MTRMARKKRSIPGITPLKIGEYRVRLRYGRRGEQKPLYYRGKFNDCRSWQAVMKIRIKGQLPVYAPIDGIENWPPSNVREGQIESHDGKRATLYQLVDD